MNAMQDIHQLSTPVAWALAYANLGWHVLPLEPGKKVPLGRLVPRGMLDATIDFDLIKKWWDAFPGAGIGIALAQSGLVAVDIDPRNGGDDTFEDLQAQHGSLRSEVNALTGGGGEHHVFVVPPGAQISLPGTLGPGVDLKCNGYIVVEPSKHPNGNTYQWEASSNPLDGVVPSPLPDWLRSLRISPKSRTAPLDGSGRVIEGGRNEHLSRRAYALRRAGLDLDDIEATLQRLNAKECNPPLSADEVRVIAGGKRGIEPDPVVYLGKGVPLIGEVSTAPDSLVLDLAQLSEKAGALKWAVKGLIPMRSIGFIFGASGTFKSFIALDYALHRVYGMKWLGRKTKKGNVVYLAAEGGAGLMRRIRAWHMHRGMNWEDCPLRVVITPLTLRTQSRQLADAIETLNIDGGVGDVIIDTLAQTYDGDENSNDQMSSWLRVLGVELRDQLDAVITVVHHSGHSETERPRGASAIIANIDFAFGVFRDAKEMMATIETVKVKDGERISDQMFKLHKIEMGWDEDGDSISSLVASHLADGEQIAEAMASEAKAGRGGSHAQLLGLVQNGMLEKELRKVFYDACESTNPETRKKAYTRAKSWAIEQGFIEVAQGVVITLKT